MSVEKLSMAPEQLERRRFETARDWRGRAVYQIYPNTFNEERPKGVEHTGRGSILGVVEKLDYLKELGIGAIWLSPFYESPMKDGGYDISNPTDVDPGLGTIDDIDLLIAECHERDIKVMIDFVPNHTSDQHRWFEQSCKDPGGEFGDYYIWADPKKIGKDEPLLPHNIVAGGRLEDLPEGYTVPNNWSSIFSLPELEKLKERYGGIIPDDVEVPAVTAWAWHSGRQQFYLAEFTKEQPSLQWANPAVRAAQTDVLRFWLDRGVDGFRVDVVNHIGKDPELRDEIRVPEGWYDKNRDNPHDQWTQQYMVSYWPTLEPHALEILATADNYDKDIRFVLEDWLTAMAGGMEHDELSRLRPELATVFNFARLLKTNSEEWNVATHKHLIDTYYSAFQNDRGLRGGDGNEVDSNHDVMRIVGRMAAEAARAAGLIKFSLPGVPYVYQGEEGGFPHVPDAGTPRHRLKDVDIGLRDGARRPIMWDAGENAGFSQTPEENLWLPIDPDYPQLNLADQAKDPRSFYSLYRALMNARNRSPELRHGVYNPMETDHGNVLAFGRSVERRQYTTVVNFSGETTSVAIVNPSQALARVALSSASGLLHDRRNDIRLDQGRILLRPHEGLLLAPHP